MSAPGILIGADISTYQRDISIRNLAAAARFVFIKASQSDWTDTSFAKLFADCRAAGMVVGAYHFLQQPGKATSGAPAPSAAVQAEHYVAAVRRVNGGSTAGVLLALDVEPYKQSKPKLPDVVAWARRFRELVPDQPLFLYTSAAVWAMYKNPPIRATVDPNCYLWLAYWTKRPGSELDRRIGGILPTVHQYGSLDIGKAKIDGDAFRGTAADLGGYGRPKAPPAAEPDPFPPAPETAPETLRWSIRSPGAPLRQRPGGPIVALVVYGRRLRVAGLTGSGQGVAGRRGARSVAVVGLAGHRISPPLWIRVAATSARRPRSPAVKPSSPASP